MIIYTRYKYYNTILKSEHVLSLILCCRFLSQENTISLRSKKKRLSIAENWVEMLTCPWELFKDEVSSFPSLARKLLSWNILSIVLLKRSPTVVYWPDCPVFFSIIACISFQWEMNVEIGYSRVLCYFCCPTSKFLGKSFFGANLYSYTLRIRAFVWTEIIIHKETWTWKWMTMKILMFTI